MTEQPELGKATNLSEGKLLSDRFKDAPRENSAEAQWLDQWVANPTIAIGMIFDLGDTRSQGHEAAVIQALVFGDNPVIDIHDFAIACISWLESSDHSPYQYQTLFNVLQKGNEFLVPEVFQWFIKNIDKLKVIYAHSQSGYNRFVEMLDFLATNKTLKEYNDWWMSEVRKSRKDKNN